MKQQREKMQMLPHNKMAGKSEVKHHSCGYDAPHGRRLSSRFELYGLFLYLSSTFSPCVNNNYNSYSSLEMMGFGSSGSRFTLRARHLLLRELNPQFVKFYLARRWTGGQGRVEGERERTH